MTTRLLLARLRAFTRRSPDQAILAAITGLAGGVGIGLPLAHAHFSSLALAAISAAVLAILVRLIVPPDQRWAVTRVLLLAMALRLAAGAVLYFGSVAIGRGYVVGDDSGYGNLARGIVGWLRGTPEPPYVPPFWNGDAYYIGSFVYAAIVVFWFFGPSLLNMDVINAAMAGAMIVFLYDMARRLYGTKPAIVAAGVAAIFPSLVLWSSVNLKEAMSWLLAATVLWIYMRYQLRPHWALLVAAFALIVPVDTLRRYLFVGLTGLMPVAVALTPRITRLARVGRTTFAAMIAAVLISLGTLPGQGTYGIPTGLDTFEAIRLGMGENARTTFADPRAFAVQQGDTFVVVDPDAPVTPVATGGAPGATGPATPAPIPSRTPRIIIVAPGTRVVLVTPSPTPPLTSGTTRTPVPTAPVVIAAPRTPEPASGVVFVEPGDIVVIGDPGTTPGPTEERKLLTLKSTVSLANMADLVETDSSPDALTATRTITYLPRGAAYAFFAPFPWDIRRPLDTLLIPEMILWYVVLGAIPWSLWRHRRQWQLLAPMTLYVLGLMAVFTLTEGNFGTLYRHRAMVTPFAIVLASPGLLAVSLWIRDRSRRSTRTD